MISRRLNEAITPDSHMHGTSTPEEVPDRGVSMVRNDPGYGISRSFACRGG